MKSIQLTNIYEGEDAHWYETHRYGESAAYSVDVEVSAVLDDKGELYELEILEVNVLFYDFNTGNEFDVETWDINDLLEVQPTALQDIKDEYERLYK